MRTPASKSASSDEGAPRAGAAVRYGILLWLLIVVGQALYFHDSQDPISSALCGAGGVFGWLVFARAPLLLRYPISTSMMIGYTLSYFVLPPIVTITEGKPLTNNLEHPTFVFFNAIVCLLAFTLAFFIYRSSTLFLRVRTGISGRIYKPLGFFKHPSNTHFLFMGAVGLVAMAQQVFVAGSTQNNDLGVDSKLIQGLYPLAYLPYCILIPQLFGCYEPVGRRWKFAIAVYTCLLLAVAVGANSRAAFLLGLASIGLAYLYAHSAGLIKSRLFTTKTIIAAVLGATFLMGPIADLATSMVYARASRSDVDAATLFLDTIQIYSDRNLFNAKKAETTAMLEAWDEHYVDNLFVARLSNLKFADSSLGLALQGSESTQTRLAELEWQRVLANFPQPVIELLDLPVDKNLVRASSGGDLLLYTTIGDFFALGGFRTGSIFGSGYAIMGWWYPIIVAGLALLLFILADAQTLQTRATTLGTTIRPGVVFNPLAVVGFFTWTFYLTSAATGVESVSGLTSFLLRGWLQVLAIYTFVFWATRLALRCIPTKMR